MNGESTIVGFVEDRGKGNDGRLTVSVKQLPKGNVVEFLDWLGNSFIEKGGLYAVDVVNPEGKYRVYKDKLEKNEWILPNLNENERTEYEKLENKYNEIRKLNLKDLEKIDMLDMDKEDVDNIQNWYINNEEYLKKHYKEIKDPFEEVIILYQSNLIYKNGNMFYVYFYNKKNSDNPKYMYGFKLNFEENKENLILHKPITNIEFLELYEEIKDINTQNNFASQDLMIISFIYSYLAFNQESIIKETRTHTKKIQSKKDKRAGKKAKVKLIKQNIIRINTDNIQQPTEEEKREYERHIAGWTVRGHWREYKSGKRVWIKPQIRGDKEQVEGKVYEIN